MFFVRLPFILLLFFSGVVGNLVEDIVDALENAVDCDSCHNLLVHLQGLAHQGDSAFSKTFTTVCDTLGLDDPDVCAGLTNGLGPIIAHDLRSISPLGQTATKLCRAAFGLCLPPPINKFTVPFPKPAPKNPKSFVSTGKTPFQVAHFSDVHIDRQYAIGSDINCTKPICCRNFADNTSPPSMPAGPFGEHNCDTPVTLVHSMLQAIPANSSFSIFTGDVVEGLDWLVNRTDVTNDLESFNAEMATLLKSPVYPAIGNHESSPVNSFPRTTSKANVQWVFDTQSEGWSRWIGPAGASEVKHISGSYSIVHPGTNLRIISVNDLMWYTSNFWLYDSDEQQPDPNGIIAFIVQELQAAEDAGQRAWMIAHMAPGRSDTLSDQSNYFDQVIQRYHNTLVGQFYGHSHKDQFGIAYSNYSRQTAENAVNMAIVASSLTPRNTNPAFKVYDVDPDTYEIMDSRVFMSNVSNPGFQANPTWEFYYSARSTYGPLVGLKPGEPLGPSFWHKLTEVFEVDDDAFQMYNTFKTVGVDVLPCDEACKNATICDLRALRAENNCDAASPGLNFRKRDSAVPVVARDDECEGVGLRHIFSRLPEKILPSDRALLISRIEEAISSG